MSKEAGRKRSGELRKVAGESGAGGSSMPAPAIPSGTGGQCPSAAQTLALLFHALELGSRGFNFTPTWGEGYSI